MYTNHLNACEECVVTPTTDEKLPAELLIRYLFNQSPFGALLAPWAVLYSFPGIYYVTPSDNSIVLSTSTNYHEREHGTWTELPPIPVEGGQLVVHWLIKPQWAAAIPSEKRRQERVEPGTRNRFRKLRTTEDDAKFVELCESWGWDVAGPSYTGSFMVLDTVGKAWIFTAIDIGPVWERNVVEALWTPYNVAYMDRRAYPMPWEEEEEIAGEERP